MVPILVGLGALLVGGLIIANWDDIVEWVSSVFSNVKDWFVRNFPTIAHYGKVLFEKIKGAYSKLKCRSYFQQDNKWYMKESPPQEIPESEVPPDILAKANRQANKEIDVTREMEMTTGMNIGG